MPKTAILGGTFDPPHIGHLEIIKAALAEPDIDRVLVMPDYAPPHKRERVTATDSQRLEMCRLLIETVDGADVESAELEQQFSYTADTLRDLMARAPETKWCLLYGGDALQSLPYWKDSAFLTAHAEIIAVHRRGESTPPGMRTLAVMPPAVSSSEIRRQLARNESVTGQIPESVEHFIHEHHLYQEENAMAEETSVYVNVDKTVVKITGLEIKGLNIQQLEQLLQSRLKTMTRIIGVTGDSIELDAYDIEESEILRDSDGLIRAIALADGIHVTDVTQLKQVKKIHQVDFDHIPPVTGGCIGERWVNT